jgi:hypothetical protein
LEEDLKNHPKGSGCKGRIKPIKILQKNAASSEQETDPTKDTAVAVEIQYSQFRGNLKLWKA